MVATTCSTTAGFFCQKVISLPVSFIQMIMSCAFLIAMISLATWAWISSSCALMLKMCNLAKNSLSFRDFLSRKSELLQTVNDISQIVSSSSLKNPQKSLNTCLQTLKRQIPCGIIWVENWNSCLKWVDQEDPDRCLCWSTLVNFLCLEQVWPLLSFKVSCQVLRKTRIKSLPFPCSWLSPRSLPTKASLRL